MTLRINLLIFVLASTLKHGHSFQSTLNSVTSSRCHLTSSALRMANPSRENEIRRKILELKREGKLKTSLPSSSATSVSDYEELIKQKLGTRKSKMLGINSNNDKDKVVDEDVQRIQAELDDDDDDADDDETDDDASSSGTVGRIGTLKNAPVEEEIEITMDTPSDEEAAIRVQDDATDTTKQSKDRKPIIDPSLFESKDGETEQKEMSDEDLVKLVTKKLSENTAAEDSASQDTTEIPATKGNSSGKKQLTSGVGGKWSKDDSENEELYQPKSGSWGAFPRPKDMSKAYGGGRRVGPGFSNEDQMASELRTKTLLKEYKKRVGIDVPSEKEHALEIEEAIEIGKLAMQRGMYATAVSALEKISPWCSTNSPVGSKVFLDLAMAYEAVGRTKEANQVYTTLTKSRNEAVKYDAKRLLYGLEAMQVMKEVSTEFSRSNIRNTFIDTTGLANIAQNFDDVYNTAYVDLDSGYYKRLTESVVRSTREARQILLKATGKGEIPRTKVVQALRSISRHFDEALEAEKAANEQLVPTAIIDGVPIQPSKPERVVPDSPFSSDEFVLGSSDQMIANMQGNWTLQLLADKKGDGVSYFNTTDARQEILTDSMKFSAIGPAGFLTTEQAGEIAYTADERIITPLNVVSSGSGNMLMSFFAGKSSGFAGAVSNQQQIVTVDSVLLVVRRVADRNSKELTEKEYFAVWRRSP